VQDRVIGILDWELSTLGNQMTDVAYSCLVLTQISNFNFFYGKSIFLCFFLTLQRRWQFFFLDMVSKYRG
jgi:aminoglycoside phosphotransferase (APT) family kinase protein